MKKIFLLACLATLPLFGNAQKLPLDKKQLLQDIELLAADSMQGRLSGTEGSQMAQQYILKRFQEIGLKPFNGSYKQHFRIENKRLTVEQATNLVGYIPGKSDKVIVVSAHYDHVGVRNGEIYNGTDDNASGVGALLAAAAYFKKNPPKHTLIFAAFDGEELGLQGANAFLEKPPVDLEQIILNVNMDMLSINNKGELYASGSHHYPQLLPSLQKVAARPKAKLLIGHDKPEQGPNDWTTQSDHFQFHKRKIPYIYFGVEDHPHYHKPTDDFVNVNPEFYAEAAALVIDFVKVVDKDLPSSKK
ncbi:M20/M25/M40 family metallo-hydrolase [Pontibacter cellulosilyticus]|uniref:M28 family peptidase n=1 Tax=Pontibacter cellulosilyticus TaxID=1720253 RepID=A0A923SPN2_9BACT|nr:M20/M25/M40 family metallo-hydrolase [Pontibacter cellulosilyticus]MBC5994315.1 M28 family peptidase [Pontibacter cellulosilyticus]